MMPVLWQSLVSILDDPEMIELIFYVCECSEYCRFVILIFLSHEFYSKQSPLPFSRRLSGGAQLAHLEETSTLVQSRMSEFRNIPFRMQEPSIVIAASLRGVYMHQQSLLRLLLLIRGV